MDLTYLLELSEGDILFVKDLLETYLQELPKDLAQLSESYQNNHVVGVQKAAHKMKSSFKLLGLHRQYELAQRIEEQARLSILDESERRALEALTSESYEQVRNYLSAT